MIQLITAQPGVSSRQVVFKDGDSKLVGADTVSLDYPEEQVLVVNDITRFHFQKVWPVQPSVSPDPRGDPVWIDEQVPVESTLPVVDISAVQPAEALPTAEPVVDIPAVQPVADPLAVYFAPQVPPAT